MIYKQKLDPQSVRKLMYLHGESEHAWLMSANCSIHNAMYLQKTQVELEHSTGRVYMVHMPEWLAREKGLR